MATDTERLDNILSGPKRLYCGFCFLSASEVKWLIHGPVIHICDKCVVICTDIIREAIDKAIQSTPTSPPAKD